MGNNLPSKILIVDNDEGTIKFLTNKLKAHNVQTIFGLELESAFYQFNSQKFDLCLVSLELDFIPGGALIQKWRNHEIESKRDCAFVLSTTKSRKAQDEALIKELGDICLIYKPIQVPQLLSIMSKAMSMAMVRQHLHQANNKIIQPLLTKGNYEKACKISKEKLEPAGLKGEYLSAKVHSKAGETKHAIGLLSKLIKSDQTNMSYHNEIAEIYLKVGNMEKAKESFELADKNAPGNIARVEEMANLYLKLQQPDKSLKKFKEVLRYNPEKPDLKYDIYDVITEAGYLDHAREFCKQTSTPKELVRHFNNKGVLYSKDGKYEEAIAEYEKATTLIPGAVELHKIFYNMALANVNLKTKESFKKAQTLLKKCLKLKPTFEKAKEKLERVEKVLGRFK